MATQKLKSKHTKKTQRPKNDGVENVHASDARSVLAIETMVNEGLTVEQVAAQFNVHKTTVYKWIYKAEGSPGARFRELVQQKIEAAATHAAEKIIELIDSYDSKIALAAAKDVLDRANFKGIERIESKTESTVASEIVIRLDDELSDLSK